MKLADLQSDFAVLDDWEDRYRYIIELGRTLPPMAPELKNEATKVRGCASQVWLVSETSGRRHHAFPGRERRPYRAGSHRHPVRGLRRQDRPRKFCPSIRPPCSTRSASRSI